MTDSPQRTDRTDINPFLRLAFDLGPLLLFFFANARAGIFAATAVFMAATLVSLAAVYALTRRVAVMPLVSALVVMVFGGLTIWLHDETFIKVKPTIIYGLFAAVLLGGLAAGRSLLSLVLDSVFHLSERGWRTLTLRWGIFFVVLAVLNEIVWRSVSTDTWVAFKTFGFLPATLLFAIAQAPLIARDAAQKN